MILIPVSGGIDSLAALWHYRHEDMTVFHLILGSHWPRRIAELEATRKAMIWIRPHLQGKIVYSEHNILPTNPINTVEDLYPVNTSIGCILQLNPDISKVCRIVIKEDFIDNTYVKRRLACYIIAETLAQRKIKWVSPFKHMKKFDVKKSMPLELFRLAISCWGPVFKHNEWHRCGSCDKCKECSNAGIY